jgi:N-acetylglucosamine-6-phosphate deacetylase
LAVGRYSSNLCDAEILPDGRIVVAGQRQILAGASRPLAAGIGNVMHFAGVDLGQAIRMATDHPSELLGIKAGNLQPGERVDFILFDLVAGEAAGDPQQVAVRKVVVDDRETSVLDAQSL